MKTKAMRPIGRIAIGILLCGGVRAVAEEDAAPGVVPLEEVVVQGRAEDLVGVAPAASMGRVGQPEIQPIPLLRVGEVLERVPGLIVTQHSGTGKANQFFLRGFNLDHGTDFSASLEGVPLNLPTHGHGQGYLDLNSLIPELIEVIEFRKGPYYADVGDFSSAGTSSIRYVRQLDQPFVSVGFGEFDSYRLVGGASPRVFGGDLLLAGEGNFYDGPWELDEDLEKFNGVGKWTWGDDARGFSLFASGYSADWNATDQIARRATQRRRRGDLPKLIGRFGNLDDDLGGNTSRYTGSAQFWNGIENPTNLQAYAVVYDLDLFSNFTYFLDDDELGDEFQQADDRTILGFRGTQELNHTLFDVPIRHTFGTDVRYDAIGKVGLFRTAARQKIETVREDRVNVTALGLYWNGEARPLPWLRGYVGLRGDVQWYDVDAESLAANSGNDSDGIASPKVGVAFGPWASTEIYLNYGRGFHSNDARGTTIEFVPGTIDEEAKQVDPLVATQGAEIGTRSTYIPGLQSTLAFWWLEIDSELLFVGDAGNTEATRPSQRYGVELTNYYQVFRWLTLDLDFTYTHSEFTDSDPVGDHIPGAIQTTVASGAAVAFDNGLFGGLHLRHFGPRPLIEDDSVESDSTTLVNLRGGYEWRSFPWGDLTFTIDVLNLLDSNDDDITYFYASRLRDESVEQFPDGIEDKHFHPVEPQMVRGYITYRY